MRGHKATVQEWERRDICGAWSMDVPAYPVAGRQLQQSRSVVGALDDDALAPPAGSTRRGGATTLGATHSVQRMARPVVYGRRVALCTRQVGEL